MRQEIELALEHIKSSHGVKILLAVEAGSRAWGHASLDSDYDIRFIYQRPLAWYLSITDRRDVILPKTSNNLDINGWDLRKVLYQIYKGNPVLFEWLHSPIVYDRDHPFYSALKQLAEKYFNPRTAMYHYLHMAQGNYRQYLKGDLVRAKKYIYVLRPLLCCAWLDMNHCIPPVAFDAVRKDAMLDEPLSDAIDKLLLDKVSSKEMDGIPKIQIINDWIEQNLAYFNEKVRLTQRVELLPDDLNEFFLNQVGRL